MKKIATMTLMLIISLSLAMASDMQVSAAAKVKLSKTKITVTVGKTKTIRLKKVKNKVTWKVSKGKKNIAIKKKTGKYKNTVKIYGKKAGAATLTARVKGSKKVYKCKITIKKKNTSTNASANTNTSTNTNTGTDTGTAIADEYISNGYELIEGFPVDKIIDIADDGVMLSSNYVYYWDSYDEMAYGAKLSRVPQKLSDKTCKIIIIENKDGSYSFCDRFSLDKDTTPFLVEGVSIKSGHKVVGAVKTYVSDSVMCVYTLYEGKLYITGYDKNGKIDSSLDYQWVKMDKKHLGTEHDFKNEKIIDYWRTSGESAYILFEDGALHGEDMGSSVLRTDTDTEGNVVGYYVTIDDDNFAEKNISKLYNVYHASSTNIVYLKENDMTHIYVESKIDYNNNVYNYTEVALPSGYTTDDIRNLKMEGSDIILITDDKSVYSVNTYSMVWKKDAYLSSALKNSKFLQISSDGSDFMYLFENGKVYK
ncbi:MAG: hypothetical protein ACLRZ9_11570 [Eubacterium sp.]